jgi:hypothetical protein
MRNLLASTLITLSILPALTYASAFAEKSIPVLLSINNFSCDSDINIEFTPITLPSPSKTNNSSSEEIVLKDIKTPQGVSINTTSDSIKISANCMQQISFSNTEVGFIAQGLPPTANFFHISYSGPAGVKIKTQSGSYTAFNTPGNPSFLLQISPY